MPNHEPYEADGNHTLRRVFERWIGERQPDSKRLSSRLQAIINSFLAILAALTVFYVATGVEPLLLNVAITTASALLFLVMLFLLRRGMVRFAGACLLLYLYIATTAIALSFDGIHDTSLVVYFLLIAISGLTLGGNAALLASVATVVALGLVYRVDALQGGITDPRQPAFLKVFEMAGLLLVMGLVLRMTIRDLSTALQQAHRENVERKAAQLALARARDELEERVRARTIQLERLNGELTSLVQASRNGILFLSPEERRLAVINAKATDLLQLPGGVREWQGRSLDDVLDTLSTGEPEIATSFRNQLSQPRTSESRAALEGELEIGGRLVSWYAAELAIDEEARELIVLHDVTAERDAEQLRHDLVQTMVHDLRNPLSGMLSVLGLLKLLDQHQKEPLSDQQRRYVERLIGSVDQMTRLVNNILDVSRLESHQLPLHYTSFTVKQLVNDVVSAQLPLAASKGVQLASMVDHAIVPVYADKSLVARVLQNLIDNAIKFTPSGGLIDVIAEPAEQEHGSSPTVSFTVSDSGPGVPAEMTSQLFQKFSAGNHHGAGSGLGLAFCRLAVEAHGGRLWLDREQGPGATFVFTLPVTMETPCLQPPGDSLPVHTT